MTERLGAIEVKVDRIDARVAHIEAAQHEERGGRRIWRLLGSLTAAAALSIGGYAASIAQTAASDHGRLNRLHEDVADGVRARRVIATQQNEMSRQLVRIEEMLHRIDETSAETREDVRELQKQRRGR